MARMVIKTLKATHQFGILKIILKTAEFLENSHNLKSNYWVGTWFHLIVIISVYSSKQEVGKLEGGMR